MKGAFFMTAAFSILIGMGIGTALKYTSITYEIERQINYTAQTHNKRTLCVHVEYVLTNKSIDIQTARVIQATETCVLHSIENNSDKTATR